MSWGCKWCAQGDCWTHGVGQNKQNKQAEQLLSAFAGLMGLKQNNAPTKSSSSYTKPSSAAPKVAAAKAAAAKAAAARALSLRPGSIPGKAQASSSSATVSGKLTPTQKTKEKRKRKMLRDQGLLDELEPQQSNAANWLLGLKAKANGSSGASQSSWASSSGKKKKWQMAQIASAPFKLLEQALKQNDLKAVLNLAKRSQKAVLQKAMPKILDLAAKTGSSVQYAETLALCAEHGIKFDVATFTRMCTLLTSRVPAPTGMIRLTLNLAIPKDGQIVPLIPVNATEEQERAVFEDGEHIPTTGRQEQSAAVLDSKPSKELGPQPEIKDEAENSEARLALTKVQPASLRGLVQGRDAATTAYFGHFAALLHLETIVELQAVKRRLQRPIENLERFGWTLKDLKVRSVHITQLSKAKKGGGLPGREPGSKRSKVFFDLPRQLEATRFTFRPGDSVILSRNSPLEDMFGEGIVADAPIIEEDLIGQEIDWELRKPFSVTFDANISEKEVMEGTWRLDKGANRTAYDRQFMALYRLATAKDEKRNALWDCLPLTGVGGSNVDAWAKKMQGMLDDKQKASLEGGPNEDAAQDPMAALAASIRTRGKQETAQQSEKEKREAKMQEIKAKQLLKIAGEEVSTDRDWVASSLGSVRSKLQWTAGNLNPSQIAAVSQALGRRLSLIQGPPGTGKTTVSCRLLEIWAKKLRVKPLLATSDSNIAVDNIAEGARALGLNVVRVGRPERVTSALEEVTLEYKLRQMRGEDDSGKGKGKENGKGKGKENGKRKDKGEERDQEVLKERRVQNYEDSMAILKQADVICTTTVAGGSDFMSLLKFGAILIDEVAQATELSAIVPVIMRGADRLVLVGDHCQLPPSVCSMEAETRGLSLSLFGRLAAQGLDPYFLDTQFRMHPMIASFSAQEFYHGKLKTGVDPSSRPPPRGFDWPKPGAGIAFVHADSYEQRDGESRSNPAEVQQVLEILAEVLSRKELGVLDIGIVSPYAAQVRALRSTIRRELPSRLRGYDVDLTAGLPGRQGQRALEIASVDAFQGREKELIIFSAVRSNRHGAVGFLQDWRRLNVMITRARRGLIVIGNTTTLRGDATWGRWLGWAAEEGLIVDKGAQEGMRSNSWKDSSWQDRKQNQESSWQDWRQNKDTASQDWGSRDSSSRDWRQNTDSSTQDLRQNQDSSSRDWNQSRDSSSRNWRQNQDSSSHDLRQNQDSSSRARNQSRDSPLQDWKQIQDSWRQDQGASEASGTKRSSSWAAEEPPNKRQAVQDRLDPMAEFFNQLMQANSQSGYMQSGYSSGSSYSQAQPAQSVASTQSAGPTQSAASTQKLSQSSLASQLTLLQQAAQAGALGQRVAAAQAPQIGTPRPLASSGADNANLSWFEKLKMKRASGQLVDE